MPDVITVANQKGGVGKTTTVVHLGHGLALRGKRVLIVDLDPQGHCAVALGHPRAPGIFNALVAGQSLAQIIHSAALAGNGASPRPRAGLFLLPGDKRTKTARTVLLEDGLPLQAGLEALLDALGNNLDVIIFDTSPSVGGFQEAALRVADLVVIPSAPDYLSLQGILSLGGTLAAMRRGGWEGRALCLPTFHDEVTRQSRENYAVLTDKAAAIGLPLSAPIHRATVLRDASAAGLTIFEHAPRCRAAEEYASLVFSVMEEL